MDEMSDVIVAAVAESASESGGSSPATSDKPEPTGESTVEEALEYVLVTLLTGGAERYKESLFSEWEHHFDEMKQEIVRISHEKENELRNAQEAEIGTEEEQEASQGAEAEGEKKQGARQTKATNKAKAAVVPLRFVVTKGYHTGQTFHLQCTAAKPCFVGRSKQAKYKKNGLSLHQDLEMSTAHAQIGLDADTLQPYIVDTGSSNGSYIVPQPPPDPDDETAKRRRAVRLKPNVKVPLHDGMAVRMGQTTGTFEFA